MDISKLRWSLHIHNYIKLYFRRTKVYASWGISTYQQQFGQQRIELGSSFYVVSAGWSDFTLFWTNKILTISEEEIRPPEKNDKWPLKDSRGKGFHILWCSASITFILPVYDSCTIPKLLHCGAFEVFLPCLSAYFEKNIMILQLWPFFEVDPTVINFIII